MTNDFVQIDIGFSRSKSGYRGLFSLAIRYGMALERFLLNGTWNVPEYSHVYLGWHSVGAGVDVVYHASGTMLHFLNRDILNRRSTTTNIIRAKLPRESYKKLIRFCMTHAGADYGVKQILGIAWVKINRLMGFNIKNPYGDGRRSQVCSELIGFFMIECMDIPVTIDLDVADPMDIFELATKHFGGAQ